MRRQSVILAGCILLASPAFALDMPPRKPGLWELKMEFMGRQLPVQVIKQCVDAASDKLMNSNFAGSGQVDCAKQDVTHNGASMVVDSVCQVGPATTTTHAVINGSFDSGYTVEVTSTRAGGPPLPGVAPGGATHMKIAATWLGPCGAGLRPGDMIMSNGMKMNILDIQKMGPPSNSASPARFTSPIGKRIASSVMVIDREAERPDHPLPAGAGASELKQIQQIVKRSRAAPAACARLRPIAFLHGELRLGLLLQVFVAILEVARRPAPTIKSLICTSPLAFSSRPLDHHAGLPRLSAYLICWPNRASDCRDRVRRGCRRCAAGGTMRLVVGDAVAVEHRDDSTGPGAGLVAELAERGQRRLQARDADGEAGRRHRLAHEARHQPVVAPAAADRAEAHRAALVVLGFDQVVQLRRPGRCSTRGRGRRKGR